MARTPNTYQIIRHDRLGYPMLILPLMMWLLYFVMDIFVPLLNGQPVVMPPLLLLILIAITVFGWAVVLWRIGVVRQIFKEGARAEGVITNAWFFTNSGRLEIHYTYQGAGYDYHLKVMATDRTKRLTKGTSVTMIVNPDQPEEAFIEALFV